MRTVRSEVRGCYQTWSEGVCGGAGNGEQPKLLLLPPGGSSSWHFLRDELICVLVRATSCCSWAQADCWLLSQFAESQLPWFAAPPVASSPRSRTRPFQKKVHIDKCAPPEGESSRNIRYTVMIAAAQRVQSFCSPGSASPPPVSMRASCADSKLTPATGSSRSVLLVVQRKHPGDHDLTGGIAYLIPWI